MENSGFRSFADLGMDDPPFFQQFPVDSLDELPEIAASSWEDFLQSYGSQQPVILDFKRPAAESSQFREDRPLKQLRTTTFNSCEPKKTMSDSPPSTSCFVQLAGSSLMSSSPPVGLMVKPRESWCSSHNLTSPPHESIISQSSCGNTNYNMIDSSQVDKTKVGNNIRLWRAKDHILAERKRREKLSQRFIALSTLIPRLKKMDKASILGDAIKYMTQLQDKVKTLEEQTKKTTMESMAFAIKKYEIYSSSDSSFSSGPIITESFPVIEARFCNKDVLISIHCEKKKGILEKIVAEIEKLHLSVVNSSVITYGDSALNITVIAEKDEELTVSMKELVNSLRCVLRFVAII